MSAAKRDSGGPLTIPVWEGTTDKAVVLFGFDFPKRGTQTSQRRCGARGGQGAAVAATQAGDFIACLNSAYLYEYMASSQDYCAQEAPDAPVSDKDDRQAMPTPAAAALCEGARVIIAGLQAKPQHNGRAGVVCGDFDRDTGRWTVDLDAGDAGPAFRGSFRAANLVLVPSLSFSTQWLDEDGRVCPKNVNFLHQCPKGHALVPLGNCCGEGDGDLPLLCRACHCITSHAAPNWMVCSTTASCCGGYAVCADCAFASVEAPATATFTENFPALVNAVRTPLSCKL